MATPWLLSMGACIIFSALFSKLWRLNRLLNTGFRRIALKEKDVIAPATALFIMNLVILICWSAISPLQWERVSVAGQPWNTVGVCMSQNKAVEIGCWAVLGSINFGALLLCCWQAYKARIHSDEFREAKGIGMAMFSWLQLTLIGLPVLLLIDQDDVTARYFVTVGLVFLACMSLLFCIFIPIWKNMKEHDSVPTRGLNRGRTTHISGISTRVQQSRQQSVSFSSNDQINQLRSFSTGRTIEVDQEQNRLHKQSTL
jgi:gamma-aminobutyric acid type B receptor